MGILDEGGLKEIGSYVVQLPKKFVTEIYLDCRDFKRWSTDRIPRWTVFVTEKWLGFWYTFLAVQLVGILGFGAVWTAQWFSNSSILVATVPQLIHLVATGGILAVLLYGLALAGTIIASALRVLFGVRDISKRYWRKNTPPYSDTETGQERRDWPLSDTEKEMAKKNMWKLAERGTILFMVVFPILLWIELNYASQFNAALQNLNITSAGDVVDTSIWMIDFGPLFESLGLSFTTGEFVVLLLLFGFPTFFFTLSARNLLFWNEANVRSQLETAAKEGWPGRVRLWLFTQSVGFVVWGSGILYQIFYTL